MLYCRVFIIYGNSEHLLLQFILCAVGGFAGSVIDSVLGATVQVKYQCEESGKITEKRVINGNVNKVISGFPVINNDALILLAVLLRHFNRCCICFVFQLETDPPEKFTTHSLLYLRVLVLDVFAKVNNFVF